MFVDFRQKIWEIVIDFNQENKNQIFKISDNFWDLFQNEMKIKIEDK